MDITRKNREPGWDRKAGKETPRKRPAAEEKKTRPAQEKSQRRPAQRSAADQREERKRTAQESPARKPRQAEVSREEAAQSRPASRPEKEAQRPAKQKRISAKEETRKAPSRSTKAKSEAQPRQKRQARASEPSDLSSKKRAYGNSKPKKKPLVIQALDFFESFQAKRRAARNAPEKSGRKKTAHSGQPVPVIIYTQPKTFNLTRLLIQMLTVAAVVAALVLGLSVFFKVETITVTGAETYSAWSVREASGINEGDNLLTFSHARAGALIKANLPYVKTVRFGIKLPDTVNIIIEEEDVVYAVKDTTGTWWLMNSGGRIVEQANGSKASNHTQVLGVTLENPSAGSLAIAKENVPTETDPSGEAVPVTNTGAQRLNAAMQILQALEANDIVGEAASVDVTRLEDIILWYGSRYQVNLGDSTNLEYKINCMSDVILQLSEFESGVLDISFTIWPDQVIYTPFT